MATIKTISVSYARKISDGNYGSHDVSFFESYELEEDEDPTPVYREARARVQKQVRLALKEVGAPIPKPKER
jgi:hypothetical protein